MVKAVVGANWGDEGKGKITDMLAEKADIIVRFQGGANAGHTIVNNYGKFALHTLPSGVFYDHTTSVIGNGVALNIPVFFKEYNEVVSRGVPAPKHRWLCHTIFFLTSMRKNVWAANLSDLPSQVLLRSTQTNMQRLVSR